MTRHDLKYLRVRYQLTQRDLAEMLGMTTSQYGLIERGKTSITPRTANIVLDVFSFGRTPKEIVGINEHSIIFN